MTELDKVKRDEAKKQKAEEDAERERLEGERGTRETALKPFLNKLVEYYDEGRRYGFLTCILQGCADIQPLGGIAMSRPRLIAVDVLNVKPETQPCKHATLDEYARAVGWEDNVKATLFIPAVPKAVAPKDSGKRKLEPEQDLPPAAKATPTASTGASPDVVPNVKRAPKKVALIDLGDNIAAKLATAIAEKQGELVQQAADAGATPILQIHDDIVVATAGTKEWNPTRAVELHKSGMKIIDIAVEMGYPRGSGCNRTKAALQKAGVL